MLHALLGTVNPREACPLKNGPPNGPFGFRVSTTRHGVIGTKDRGLGGTTLTVSEAMLLAKLDSLMPKTPTVLVIDKGALGSTLTLSVMGG